MSFRVIPVNDDEFKQWMRDVSDAISDLQSGGAIAGQVSFGPLIKIGDVQIEIVPAGGDNRDVVFTNTLNGLTDTINL